MVCKVVDRKEMSEMTRERTIAINEMRRISNVGDMDVAVGVDRARLYPVAVEVTGNTFSRKDGLKALGAKWDGRRWSLMVWGLDELKALTNVLGDF